MPHGRPKPHPRIDAALACLHGLMPADKSWRHRVLLVLVLMAVALGARLLIAPLDGGIQYITFFPSVAIAAVLGGFWAGMFAALIGTLLATYLFWPPYMAWTFGFEKEMLLSNAVFLVDALLVCTAIEAMHSFYRRFLGAEEDLRLAATVYAHSSEGIMVTDANSRILTVNPAFTEITGYAADEAVGQSPALLRSNRHEPRFYDDMWQAIAKDGSWQGEVWNRRKNGEAYLQWLSINRATDQTSRNLRFVAVFRDITDSHLKDEQIRHLAFHDPLTGLPNRLILYDRLQHAIARTRREDECLALIFLDLDRFKEVNDRLGHEIGDLLLQEVARRIQDHLRASDTAVRLGGDEFVVLMEGQDPVAHCPRASSALIRAISQPMELQGHTVQVGASLGVAYFPDDAEDMDTLLNKADAAMYAAKSAGRNTYRLSADLPPMAASPVVAPG